MLVWLQELSKEMIVCEEKNNYSIDCCVGKMCIRDRSYLVKNYISNTAARLAGKSSAAVSYTHLLRPLVPVFVSSTPYVTLSSVLLKL